MKKLILMALIPFNVNAGFYFNDISVNVTTIIFGAALNYTIDTKLNAKTYETIEPPPNSTVTKYGSRYITTWDPQCVCYKKELSN